MAETSDRRSATPDAAQHVSSHAVPPGPTVQGSLAAPAAAVADAPSTQGSPPPRPRPLKKLLLTAGIIAAILIGGYFVVVPWLKTALNTISTDDAYVNGHVTFVAPRVSGQVSRVLVDDNDRVKKGDLLVQLDKEPYELQVAIKQATVQSAQAALAVAKADVIALEAQGGSQRWQLENAMEQVASQIANLRANVATYESNKATLRLAQQNLKRAEELVPRGGMSKEDLDVREQAVKVAEAAVNQSLEAVYATRAGLGLPRQPAKGRDLTDVPPDLDQTFSGVRTALYNLVRFTAQVGLPLAGVNVTPREFIERLHKRDPVGDMDRVLKDLVPNAPGVKQAEAKLLEAQRNLDQAKLDLRYCDIISEIDGVVASRNVNPGNFVQVGQNLMAVRSVREIWIDANFKETQLSQLRIGQRVRCDVDMYGGRQEFEGRITGFTMGTGQTLSLLPPQNATGNFVKIVQRLPVRIELTDYDPDKTPLFVGVSVVPYVYFKEKPTGPDAGAVLRPWAAQPQSKSLPTP